MGRIIKNIFLTLILIALLVCCAVICLNTYVVSQSQDRIVSEADAARLGGADCILVLGCGLRPNGQPSDMLADRLSKAVELYNAGVAPKLLMSGDHGSTDYDEVNTMKAWAIEKGVPSSDIFMDHAGFSTYESAYRSVAVFQAQKVVIVTQEYHLYRAVYVSSRLGLDVYGVATDPVAYAGQPYREARELLARVKDVFYAFFMPKPTYLGEAIPVFGDGDVTNDSMEIPPWRQRLTV